MNRDKPSLPHGWIVKISSSYPDRVYYFNLHTGVSTWEMPKLVTPKMGSKLSKVPLKNLVPKSPCANFSTDDDSDGSHNYGDRETSDQRNEPVFSEFQKEIYEDIIRNSPVHNDEDANKSNNDPCRLEKRHGGSSKNRLGKPSQTQMTDDVEFQGIGIEFPDVKVKVEEETKGQKAKCESVITKQTMKNITQVLSKIRKDVADADLSKRLKKDVNKGSSHFQRSDFKYSMRKVVSLDETLRNTKTSCSVSKPKQALETTESLETSNDRPERLSVLEEKEKWTRKRKTSSRCEDIPSKVEKSQCDPDLSLKIRVGEEREVILSPNRDVKVAGTPSSEYNWDLTDEGSNLHIPQLLTKKSEKLTDISVNSLDRKSSKLCDEIVAARIDAKIRQRKISFTPDEDVRKVVSSESEVSSVQGDMTPTLPLQAERIGRVQEWLKHINDNTSSAKSETSPVISKVNTTIRELSTSNQSQQDSQTISKGSTRLGSPAKDKSTPVACSSKSMSISTSSHSKSPSSSSSPSTYKFAVTTDTKMEVCSASSSADKPLQGDSSNEEVKNMELVSNCFQTVWANIHSLCIKIEKHLSKPVYISLLHRLMLLLVDLRRDFALCLSLSLYATGNRRGDFERLCKQLNTFFIRLNHQHVDVESITTDSLLAYFHSTDKRPTLQIGLKQLDTISSGLNKLAECLSD